jgi:hypothetical protein
MRIQALLREIVIIRDGGCILRSVYGIPGCGGYAKDGHLIWQADHLITRGSNATYADSRLVVCVCKAHHAWKSLGSNVNKAQYEAAVRKVLSPDRVSLWDRCEIDRHRTQARKYASDWTLAELALQKELRELKARLSKQ